MTRKTRKKLVRIILIPVVSVLILVLVAIGILYSQQQRLVRLAVTELNKKLPGELVIGSSQITPFQNFPYISIGLNNVQLFAGKSRAGKPIFEAERMFAGFSLPDILKQKYRVKVIALKNGDIDLVQDSLGHLNIEEAIGMNSDSAASKNAPSSEIDLDVKKMVLKNMKVSFLDMQNGQRVVAQIEKIQSSLLDDSRQLDADLQGEMVVDYTHPGDTTLFRHKHLETDIRLSYDKPGRMLKLTEGKLKLENALFTFSGTADLLHDNLMDLKFSGDKPDFRQLFAFAPASLSKELKHFRYDGYLAFNGTVKGHWKSGRLPRIDLSFSCSNAWLHNTEAHKELDSLAFKGYYTNGAGQCLQTSELRLLDMKARPGKGLFRGNFVLRDFTDPKIAMQVNSDLELEFIGAFLGIKDLQRITGHISLKMNFRELVDLELPEQSMGELTEGIQSELTVRNLTFRVPGYPYIIEHLNLHANMKDGAVKLDTLSFNVGGSDFHMDGSLSDLPALFHHQQKPVSLALNARSGKLVLKELLASDSARSSKAKEEIYGFTIGLALETSVDELRHPRPLPKGKLTINHLNAAFKQYPHAFHEFGAELTINDTSLLLKNLIGRIDSSDVRFSGRVNNYPLWFEKVKRGRTQVAFDLRSQRLALNDVLGNYDKQYVPKDYQQEVATNLWLRMKADLNYDSVFKFASCKIANISGDLMQHPFDLDSLHGNVKFGTDNFIKIDTLTGKIGNSDFTVSMRLYTGKDTTRRKKENYLRWYSHFLDVDQLTNYLATAEEAAAEEEDEMAPAGTDQAGAAGQTGSAGGLVGSTGLAGSTDGAAQGRGPKISQHAEAFNIFRIPFVDFSANVSVDKIQYHQLRLKNFFTNARMQASQQLYLDTFHVQVAEGNLSAQAHFDGSDPKQIYLRSDIQVRDVNIEKLMLKLDNLGEDYVINKNIKGRLNGRITSYVQVHPDLTPIISNSEAELDIAIYNGVLMNFGPMQAMASYFSDKNLNKIRFDTLQNKLTFKNGALSIPAMNINSSLGFMEISGRQSMDMQMEYYLRIPLKMVTEVGFHMLFGKKKEEVNPDQVDAIEYRDKEKKVRFMNIKITGTPDDYKVHLGKAKKA